MAVGESDEHWIWPLVEMGLTVFPLGTPGEEPPGWVVERAGGDLSQARSMWPKQPRGKWKHFQNEKASDAQIEQWIAQHPGCNFAIATGKEIDVVDCDDEEAIAWARANLTRTPWVVRTGKGAHFYYQKSEKFVHVKNSTNELGKVDTRGHGGYVVAPGSTHANGTRYVLEIDPSNPVESVHDLPCLTGDDIEKINNFKRPEGKIGGPGGNLAGFDARKYSAIETGVHEGGRNQNMTRLVGGWIRDGYSLDQVLAKATQTNAGNQPPMSDQEVIGIVQSVMATHFNNHAEDLATAIVEEAPQSQGLLLKPGELQVAAPTWLVKGVMPANGIGVLFGPSGAGKSFVILDMVCSVAAGMDWHGRKVKRPGAVIYVCGEGQQGVANRLRAWEKHTGVDLDGLPLRVTRMPVRFLDPASVNALAEAINAEVETLGVPVLVVVDTLNRNFGDGDENTTKDMTRFINAITNVQKALDTTMLIVHHTGLQDGDRARGSSALRASLDFEISQKVLSDGEAPEFCLVGKKMKDGSQMPDSHFALKFVPLGEDEDGDVFGSCVIEPLASDKVAAARTANNLMKSLGKNQAALLGHLRELASTIEENKPGATPTVDRQALSSGIKSSLGPSGKNSSSIITDAVKKGWLIDHGTYLEITEKVYG